MSYSAEVLADSPLVYWRLGEASGTSAADASGNGRTGTYSGTYTQGVTGLLTGDSNTAVTLGANGLVTVADTTDLSAFTAEAWIKTTDTGGAFISRTGSPTTNRVFYLETSGNVARAIIFKTNSTLTSVTGTTTITDNAAHHVAMTYDGTTLRLYVNGVEEGTPSTAVSGTLNTADAPLVLGGRGTTHEFDGTIDEAAYYTTALSGARIAAHNTAGRTSSANVTPTFLSSGATVYAPTLVDTGLSFSPSFLSSGAQVFAPTLQASVTVTPALMVNVATFHAPKVVLENTQAESEINGSNGAWDWTGVGEARWTPPVVPPTGPIPPQQQVVAQAYTAPTIDGTHALINPTYLRENAHRERILIAGRDVSFFRDVPTPAAEYQLVQPFLWGAASIELPQIVLPFEQPGYGDLTWLRKGATVLIQDVDNDTDEVVATRYRGIIDGFDLTGRSLRISCGGALIGRAQLQDRQPRLIQSRRDAGGLVASALRGLRGVVHQPILGATTGIELIDWGGGGLLDYLNELNSKMTTVDGDKWTVMPDDNGVFHTTIRDVDTIHGTVYFDARVRFEAQTFLEEEPNRIFASGVTPDGMAVKFGAYPGLIQGAAAPYPMNDNSAFGIGTTDGDTDTGDGISIMGIRLRVTGYLDARPFYSTYDADMAEAIKDLQRDAELAVTGTMNVATWHALWDLSVTGYDLRGIEVLPAAEDPAVKPFRRSGTGAIIARNPNYDPTVNPVDRTVAMGVGTKAQLRRHARNLLVGGELWRGTIELNLGAIVAGDHTPGDPITSILRDREIKPGMNLSAPLFAGGIVLHVAGVSVAGDRVTLVVSTVPDDTLPTWAAIQRDRDNRNTVHRSFFAQRRSSSFERENTFDEVGGTIQPVALAGGKWTVFPVVAKQAGTIEKIRMRVSPAREFVVAVFARYISPGRLRQVTNAPLTEAGRKRWTEESIYDRLNRDHVVLYVAGSDEDPCGYFPKRKSEEDTPPTLTGRWEDDASFDFVTFMNDTDRGSVLWVAVWVPTATTLTGGRIMWPSAEDY